VRQEVLIMVDHDPHHINSIQLTSHPGKHGSKAPKITWGAASLSERGPIVATTTTRDQRNAIGTHSGAYSLYRALAIAAGTLNPDHKADLTDTSPAAQIGPHPAWHDATKIISLDPYGHMVVAHYQDYAAQGIDVRPSIAVTKAYIHIPEITYELERGNLQADGVTLLATGAIAVTKAAIEPVWYLPGIAARFAVAEGMLRRILFEETGGMFPELVTRPDLKVFLPPIGGMTVYIIGSSTAISDQGKELTVRVHDECNGSDVFGSDICTCRPYLVHGIDLCVKTAQAGGTGIIVYNRKEGRALGEVTKFLVYNARKRQNGGDSALKYFERTECVAGVQDMRFQELMPDVLHWLGVEKIDTFASMSNMKLGALKKAGITVVRQASIPENMIPEDANVEMAAKRAAGYFSEQAVPDQENLKNTKGRPLEDKKR
jgi:GTP cyclohydrolase II